MTKPQYTTEELQYEEWRLIKDFPEYEISNLGRVRRAVDRIMGRRIAVAGEILKPYQMKNGYYAIKFKRHTIQKHFLIHRLVAIAFIDNPTQESCVNHVDGIRWNNRYTNLEWCSQATNMYHAAKMLKSMAHGSSHYRAVLTEKLVIDIHELRMQGFRPSRIARILGIHVRHIDNVVKRRAWMHVLEKLSTDYPPVKLE